MRIRFRVRVPAGPVEASSQLEAGSQFLEVHDRFARIPFPGMLLSVVIHAIAIKLLLSMSPLMETMRPHSAYDMTIAPHETKIVWYPKLSRAKKLPDVSPSANPQKSSQPVLKRQLSPDVLVVEQKAKSSQQVIWTPTPKIELPKDVEAPNVVSRTSPPAAPSPAESKPATPPPPPKTFIPPVAKPKLPIEAAAIKIESAPPLLTSTTIANPLANMKSSSLPTPTIAKRFVPPSPAKGAGNIPQVIVVDGPPEINATENATVSQAILSLKPNTGALPNAGAIRRAEISAGPDTNGSAKGSDAASGSVVIPGVTARGAKSPEAGAVANLPAPSVPPTVEQKRLWNTVRTTILAPLRPSARVLPPHIESLFRGRVVYAVAIPVIDDPSCSGDWVVWFAEQGQSSGFNTPIVRAPVPVMSKGQPATASGQMMQTGAVQLRAVIHANGVVDSIELVSGSDTATVQFATAALRNWTFLPALRNNNPIDTDALIEIPVHPPSR